MTRGMLDLRGLCERGVMHAASAGSRCYVRDIAVRYPAVYIESPHPRTIAA